jgi:hypothetical protein
VLRPARGMRTEEGEDIEWGERMEEEKRRWKGNCFCTIVDAVAMVGENDERERENQKNGMGEWVKRFKPRIKGADLSSAVSNDLATTGENFLVFQRQLEGIYLHLLSWWKNIIFIYIRENWCSTDIHQHLVCPLPFIFKKKNNYTYLHLQNRYKYIVTSALVM